MYYVVDESVEIRLDTIRNDIKTEIFSFGFKIPSKEKFESLYTTFSRLVMPETLEHYKNKIANVLFEENQDSFKEE